MWRLPMTRQWTIPTDPFDRIVYLEVWNTWLLDRIWRWVHNVQVEMQRQGHIDYEVTDILVQTHPQNIKELQLEKRFKNIETQKGEHDQPFVFRKYRNKRTAIFAIQCLLNCSEQKAKQMITRNRQPSFIMCKSSKEKFKQLKSLFEDYGISISASA